MSVLRVIDAGDVGARRSQALWHGLASAARSGDDPILSFCRPTEPYLCLGYHRSLAEVDRGRCRALGLPVIRRRIGGGPVYIDPDQLFFQLTVPAELAPQRVDLLYERALGPAVEAFRRLGLDAHLRGVNDIAVGERKISGTGAGRIGDGVTVVGNVIFRFPHHRMAELLSLPSPGLAAACLRLMRRYVSSLEQEGRSEVSPALARETLTETYASALRLEPRRDLPRDEEESEIRRWERRFAEPRWLYGNDGPERRGRQIKISTDAWLWSNRSAGLRLEAAFASGTIDSLVLEGTHLNGEAASIRGALVGRPANRGSVERRLAPFGALGDELARILMPGLRLR